MIKLQNKTKYKKRVKKLKIIAQSDITNIHNIQVD